MVLIRPGEQFGRPPQGIRGQVRQAGTQGVVSPVQEGAGKPVVRVSTNRAASG